MSFSQPFIERPIGTTLLAVGLFLLGLVAYFNLPVASLPSVEFPTIRVTAVLPGADPETMASAVATPLERQFAKIAGINEMTSTSSLGQASITLQYIRPVMIGDSSPATTDSMTSSRRRSPIGTSPCSISARPCR